jgi:DNA adenine methylase
MISTSPLRYPGGKARFSDFIAKSIANSGENLKVLVEPFCGGAGASIGLLELGKVPAISLNDSDFLVSSFWQVVFGKSRPTNHDINWLIRKVESTPATIRLWKEIKVWNPRTVREAAWKCLFLNRTSFNGILHKAGPVGGWEQKKRTLDARFNREKIVQRLCELYDFRDQVRSVTNTDWKQTCESYSRVPGSYLYLDPPYYHKAEQLYGHLFSDNDHVNMRNYLAELDVPWMLSYDDASEVRTLYQDMPGVDGRVIDQTYSAHPVGGASFVGRELFYSNKPLPVYKKVSNQEHVGLSIVGTTQEVVPTIGGPTRISTALLAAVGS